MLFAVLSAVFAALTSILAKIGIDGVNSNPSYCYQNSGGSSNGMGYCIYDERADRTFGYQQEKLDFFNIV